MSKIQVRNELSATMCVSKTQVRIWWTNGVQFALFGMPNFVAF